MSSPRLSLVAACVLTLFLHGCGKSSSDSANVRALNLISGVTNVNINAGGNTVMSGGTFEALSGYTGVGSGNVEFKVTVPGNTGDADRHDLRALRLHRLHVRDHRHGGRRIRGVDRR